MIRSLLSHSIIIIINLVVKKYYESLFHLLLGLFDLKLLNS